MKSRNILQSSTHDTDVALAILKYIAILKFILSVNHTAHFQFPTTHQFDAAQTGQGPFDLTCHFFSDYLGLRSNEQSHGITNCGLCSRGAHTISIEIVVQMSPNDEK